MIAMTDNDTITAAVFAIGDEILSGKTDDENTPYLIRELSGQGVELKYCFILPDQTDIIGEIVAKYSRRVTWAFTAGGIGPTHDDVTIDGLAEGFGTRVVRHPDLVTLVERIYGKNATEDHMRMSRVPEGAEIVYSQEKKIPIITFGNIYIFPGVPELMRRMFTLVKERFQSSVWPERELYLNVDEGIIASYLNETLRNYPYVKIGSYPVSFREGYSVKILFRHKDETYLKSAFDFFRGQVGRNWIHED